MSFPEPFVDGNLFGGSLERKASGLQKVTESRRADRVGYGARATSSEMLPKLSESTQKSRADAIGSTEVKQYLEIESGLAKAESDSIGKLVCFLLRIRPSVVVGENWRDAP